MAKQPASGPRAAAKRKAVLDAAEKVMVDKGYSGVTSRSIGEAAGMPAPLVHYYFPTLDDLFIALLRRGLKRSKERFLEAMAAPEPLRALWEQHLDRRGTSATIELVALSHHRPAVRDALVEMSEEMAKLQARELRKLLQRYNVDTDAFPPELFVLALGGIARVVVREEEMGVTAGHARALAAIDRLIAEIESQKRPRRRAKARG